MFANTFQHGFLSLFFSVGSNPLSLWDKTVKNGHIRRVIDDEVKSLVLELSGTNVATTYITCPIKPRASLGIKLPFLVMIVKNMKKYFTFEIQILDDKDMHRRFRVSNFQSTTKVRPFCTTMPIGLSTGWNQIQFNLADFTRRAYGSTYIETMRVQIHANVRIRRIYFSDRLYSEDEMPSEFKLFLPVATTKQKEPAKVPSKEGKRPSQDQAPPVTPLPLEEETDIPSGAPPTPAELSPLEAPKEEAPAEPVEPVEGGDQPMPSGEEPQGGEEPESTEPASETTEAPTMETDGEATDTEAPTSTEPTEAGDAPPAEDAGPPPEESAEPPAEAAPPAEESAPAEAPESAPAEAPPEEAPAET